MLGEMPREAQVAGRKKLELGLHWFATKGTEDEKIDLYGASPDVRRNSVKISLWVRCG